MDHARIIVFDGLCNLCAWLVAFIIRHDRRALFRFAPAQSERGLELQSRLAVNALASQTLILIRHGAVFYRSDAVLEIVQELDGGWKHLALLKHIPRSLRDPFYQWVAVHRYRWFGQKQSCPVPSQGVKERFLD